MFAFGIGLFITQYINKTCHQEVTLHFQTELKDTEMADLVILSVMPGEQFLCTPQLCNGFTGAMICISSNYIPEPGYRLPECFHSAIWITRRTGLATLEDQLSTLSLHKNVMKKACRNCSHKMLTPVQTRLLTLLVSEIPMIKQTKIYNINYKTMAARKRNLKDKYLLNNDREIIAFSRAVNIRKKKISV